METNASTGFALGGLLILLLIVVIGLAAFGFWLWMLIHAMTNKGIKDGEKIAWVLVVFFGSLLGAIIYFFVARPKASSP